MNKEALALKDKFHTLTLANIGKDVISQEDVDMAITLHDEAMLLVPEEYMAWVKPGYTGTIPTEEEYQRTHWTMVGADESLIQYRTYSNVGSRIVAMLTDTLGLRD